MARLAAFVAFGALAMLKAPRSCRRAEPELREGSVVYEAEVGDINTKSDENKMKAVENE